MSELSEAVSTAFGDVVVAWIAPGHVQVSANGSRLFVDGRPYYVAAHLWADTIPRWSERHDMPAIVQHDHNRKKAPRNVRAAILEECTKAVLYVLKCKPDMPQRAAVHAICLEIDHLRRRRAAAFAEVETANRLLADADRRLTEVQTIGTIPAVTD